MSDLKAADFDIPTASMNKILKSTLPDNFIISKESKAAISRATGIFVFYITQAANDFARESKRSTIFPQDVVNALKSALSSLPYVICANNLTILYRELGFEDMEQPILEYLEAFRREMEEQKLNSSRNSANKNDNSIEMVFL